VQQVTVRTTSAELRPALVLSQIEGVTIANMRLPRAGQAPAITLHDVRDFQLRDSAGLADIAHANAAKLRIGWK
jgi:hypothetical protein